MFEVRYKYLVSQIVMEENYVTLNLHNISTRFLDPVQVPSSNLGSVAA
jgi:hypothetical protein